MSYLVDALKKAERERHINQRADLRSLAEGGPQPRGLASGHALRWLVGLLVACNAVLLVYLFVPTDVSEAFVAPPTEDAAAEQASHTPSAENKQVTQPSPPLQTVEAPSVSAEGSAGTRAAAAATDADPPTPVAQVSGRQDRERTARDEASSKTLPSTHRNDVDRRSVRLSNDEGSSRGRVTYSQSPLEDRSEWRYDNHDARARTRMRDDGAGAGAPDITINGHLYSSVPGRSFILVDGRRYHEGQRLTAGPAVESIDATGATLNYRGDRYHVDGPS